MTKTGSIDQQVQALLRGSQENPFCFLGPHRINSDRIQVRAFLPTAQRAWIVAHEAALPMRRIHETGLFEGHLAADNPVKIPHYQLRAANQQGKLIDMHDPYAFPPLLSEFDLHLLGEGQYLEAYNGLGAQLREIDGVEGVNFAVWAPNATGVSVVGDFNHWDARTHAMRKLIPSGVWELFVPRLNPGEKYKYRIFHGGRFVDKSDPYGFWAELPPRTASVVSDLNKFQWTDDRWLQQRAAIDPLNRPISIYEVHLGGWKRFASGPTDWFGYRELAHQLVEYCQRMGYTHLELMPISEHPFIGSWGYQTVGYFSVTSRYGTPEDFMYFVNYCHEHGIGVILDWVPAHFPRDDHGLRRFDGTALYEHDDPRQGEHPDWGTMIFNYARNEVRNFLLSNALFWLDKYHIDGLRVDAVASMLYLDYSRNEGEWIPNEYGGRENLAAISFLKRFNELAHERHPGVLTVAEESTAWGGVSRPTFVGGLGFSLKWNMGWMNDTLRYFHRDPVFRKYHHNEITFSMIYAFTENFVLPFSHDEVVHGKGSMLDQMPGDLWQRFANLRLLYSYMWTHPGKKLLFMGDDIAQWHEWNHNESLQWHLLQWDSHRGIQKLVQDLNQLYVNQPALYELDFEPAGFEWIDCHNHHDSVLAYLRRGKDSAEELVVAVNLTPVPRKQYPIGVPRSGWYQEVFNSDAAIYGGSNIGNFPGRQSSAKPAQGRQHSIGVDLPPLAVVVFKAQ